MPEFSPIPTAELAPMPQADLNAVSPHHIATGEAPLFTTFEDSLASQILGIQEQSNEEIKGGAEKAQELEGFAHDIGETALMTEIETPDSEKAAYDSFRPLTINGHEKGGFSGSYETNDPEAMETLMHNERGNMLAILPTMLDQVPLGKYVVTKRSRIYNKEEGATEAKLDREITIRETAKGRVVNPEAFTVRGANTQANAGVETLLAELGYEVAEDGRITGTPTPETIKRNAINVGVDVELLDASKIDVRTYVQAFANGKYPVAATNEDYYTHDINDDHITAMALGGEMLNVMLRVAATNALKNNTYDAAAGSIDMFTNSLGGMLYTRKAQFTTGYEGVQKHGKELGFSQREIDNLVMFTRGRAVEYGIKLLPSAVEFQPALAA